MRTIYDIPQETHDLIIDLVADLTDDPDRFYCIPERTLLSTSLTWRPWLERSQKHIHSAVHVAIFMGWSLRGNDLYGYKNAWMAHLRSHVQSAHFGFNTLRFDALKEAFLLFPSLHTVHFTNLLFMNAILHVHRVQPCFPNLTHLTLTRAQVNDCAALARFLSYLPNLSTLRLHPAYYWVCPCQRDPDDPTMRMYNALAPDTAAQQPPLAVLRTLRCLHILETSTWNVSLLRCLAQYDAFVDLTQLYLFISPMPPAHLRDFLLIFEFLSAHGHSLEKLTLHIPWDSEFHAQCSKDELEKLSLPPALGRLRHLSLVLSGAQCWVRIPALLAHITSLVHLETLSLAANVRVMRRLPWEVLDDILSQAPNLCKLTLNVISGRRGDAPIRDLMTSFSRRLPLLSARGIVSIYYVPERQALG